MDRLFLTIYLPTLKFRTENPQVSRQRLARERALTTILGPIDGLIVIDPIVRFVVTIDHQTLSANVMRGRLEPVVRLLSENLGTKIVETHLEFIALIKPGSGSARNAPPSKFHSQHR